MFEAHENPVNSNTETTSLYAAHLHKYVIFTLQCDSPIKLGGFHPCRFRFLPNWKRFLVPKGPPTSTTSSSQLLSENPLSELPTLPSWVNDLDVPRGKVPCPRDPWLFLDVHLWVKEGMEKGP